MRLFLLSCQFLILFPAILFAQGKKSIIYHSDNEGIKVLNQYTLPKNSNDSIPSPNIFNEVITDLQSNGYLLAALDSVKVVGNAIHAFFTIGEKYKWAALKPGNLDEGLLNSIGYKERFYQNKTFKYQEVGRLLHRIIRYSESNGFPFAWVKLDSIAIYDHTVHATLNYESGPLITFDTVELIGNTKTKPLFLSNYLRIKPGAPFDEKKVEQANNKLSRLPYLKVSGPSYVTFQLKEGTPHFTLTDVKSNQVDGIIGLLPNEGENGKAMITGQFDLLLNNMFGTGKKISLSWQRPQGSSQTLDIQYAHPNLFKSSVNIQAGFSLLKQDTLFINRNFLLETSLLVGKYGNIKVYGNFKVARVISEEALETNRFSEMADFDLNQYGVGYDWSNLDNYLVPTKGFSFSFRGAVGNKEIKRNPDLSKELYDSVNLNTVQYDFRGTLTNYYPLSKRVIIKSKLSGGLVVSDQLFVNDLYRIGGLKSIRGFIENEFYASGYAIGTLEAQLFLDNESYLFLFYDQGYVKRDMGRLREDYPGGLGAGITFATDAGVFTFAYALGRTEAQSFNINLSKVHFGYITRF